MRARLIVAFALALAAWPLGLAAGTARERPSITARLETPRDFGYHVGDPIPLVLRIEVASDVVVDLESLPRRGDPVGPFEVRDVRIDRARTASGSAYRVEFTLQSFVPATLTPGVVFPPLELRFALPEDRSADGGYVYRSATLPAQVFLLSPLGGGREALRPSKGAVIPRAGALFWSSVGLGALCLAAGFGMLASDAARWARRVRQERSEARRRALRTLKVLRTRYAGCDAKTPDLFLRVSSVLRRFLAEACAIPARVQTIGQIRERFDGHPLEQEIEQVLARCDSVVYDGHHATPSERDAIIREVTVLIDRLERVGCPMAGANGAAR